MLLVYRTKLYPPVWILDFLRLSIIIHWKVRTSLKDSWTCSHLNFLLGEVGVLIPSFGGPCLWYYFSGWHQTWWPLQYVKEGPCSDCGFCQEIFPWSFVLERLTLPMHWARNECRRQHLFSCLQSRIKKKSIPMT